MVMEFTVEAPIKANNSYKGLPWWEMVQDAKKPCRDKPAGVFL